MKSSRVIQYGLGAPAGVMPNDFFSSLPASNDGAESARHNQSSALFAAQRQSTRLLGITSPQGHIQSPFSGS
jgi:hypothetical protein